jgi:hypothetical protein
MQKMAVQILSADGAITIFLLRSWRRTVFAPFVMHPDQCAAFDLPLHPFARPRVKLR